MTEPRAGRPLGELVGIIVDLVAEHYGLRPAAIMGRDRARHISRARHVALALTAEFALQGSTAIGQQFDMDRTSVDHAVRVVRDLAAEGSQFAGVLAGLRQRIEERAPETRTWRASAAVRHRLRQSMRESSADPDLEQEVARLLRDLRRELTDAVRQDPAAFVQGLGEIARSINTRERRHDL